jgi:hypothetical protein
MLTESHISQAIMFVIIMIMFIVLVIFILRNNDAKFKTWTDGMSPFFKKVDTAVGPPLTDWKLAVEAKIKALQDLLNKPPTTPSGPSVP